ncbi:asparagine synthase (glutamine-hydrolyzing) [Bradyrhizobium sp. i1.3.1]
MCGIAGIVALSANAPSPSRRALLRMTGALAHRGPDERGLYRDQRAGLAHARLSIIDIAGGQQPLSDPGGPAWIVFNGEIFNYVELREQLISLGHRFRTRSDTEVVIQAYRAWGEAAFERMNGQWALAIWDASAGRLVLSRDRTGICPLYICNHQGQLYFASEIKAIFAADPAIPRAFDPAGIDQTFTFWSTVPPQSVFQGITEIEPGHVRSYVRGAVRDRAFWTPCYATRSDDHRVSSAGCNDDVIDSVRSALEAATALRMVRSDVPVGSYLSGGLDSSLVAALGSRFAGRRFQTFSVRFSDAEYDETSYQRLMARTIASEHHELMVSRQDIAEVFPKVIYHTERPILRTAPAPLFLLSKLVRERGIKVVLTGEGADEMFAGYDVFRGRQDPPFLGPPAGLNAARRPPEPALSLHLSIAGPHAGHRAKVLRTRHFCPGCARLRSLSALAQHQRDQAPVLRRHARGDFASRPGDRIARSSAAGFFPLDAACTRSVPRDQDAPGRLPALLPGRPDADGALGRRTLSIP